jgi:nucleoid-associated protein YejK
VNNNPNQTGTNRDIQVEQELNTLRRQYEQLRDRKVRTEEAVAQLSHQLETLKQQAKAEYGTSDLKELQQLLEEKRKQNEDVVAKYREHIQQVQADLAQAENAVEGD